jgi:hypothetical protein
MREIKFRAWDKLNKKLIPDMHLVNHFEEYLQCPQYELMQFTGLKDIDGVEIYEGDICLSTGGAGAIYDERIKVIIEYEPEYAGYGDYYDLEVIGNIYQNKGLLKENKI